MLQFTCEFCEKPINGVSVIVDRSHVLHPECEKGFLKRKKELLIEQLNKKYNSSHKKECECCE